MWCMQGMMWVMSGFLLYISVYYYINFFNTSVCLLFLSKYDKIFYFCKFVHNNCPSRRIKFYRYKKRSAQEAKKRIIKRSERKAQYSLLKKGIHMYIENVFLTFDVNRFKLWMRFMSRLGLICFSEKCIYAL